MAKNTEDYMSDYVPSEGVDWGGAQSQYGAEYRKQLARNRFASLLNNRGDMSTDQFMRDAFQLSGDYAGLDFDTAEYRLPRGSFEQDAPPGGGASGTGYDQSVSSLMDLDQSVSSVTRPLRGHEKHTLTDDWSKKLRPPEGQQTAYLDPHRAPQYEGQDPVYRGKTPQFSLGTIDQLKMDKPSPFDPSPTEDRSKPNYEARMQEVDRQLGSLSPTTLGEMADTGFAAFGEVAPLMQARGKAQMKKAVLDKLTGKMQLEMSKKVVEAGFKQFNSAMEGLQKTDLAIRQATRNPFMLESKTPSSSTTVLDALRKLDDQDLNNAETMLGWVGEQEALETKGLLSTATGELSEAQEGLTGPIASAALSLAGEAGKGQVDPAKALARTAGKVGGGMAGAATGAALGAMTGPLAPVLVPGLSMLFAMGGGAVGGEAAKKFAPAAGQMGAQEIARPSSDQPSPGLGKLPTMDELLAL